MQHGHPKRQPIGEALARQPFGPMGRELHVLQLGEADQFAGGHHLGQHHGNGLQVLNLVLAIDAGGAVLHHQGADGSAAPKEWHTEKGVERVFPRLRPVGEFRVQRRIGQVQGPPKPHDLRHQPFAGFQPGDMYGGGIETFGGEQLHVAGRPAQVDGADLRHHRLGDHPHDHVQARLSGAAAGHGLANLPQQTARTPDGQHPIQRHQPSETSRFSPAIAARFRRELT